MDCRETKRTLLPGETVRVSDADVEQALRHAEKCEGCGWIIERDRRVAQMIRDAVPRVRAPRELRERLYTVLARERTGPGLQNRLGRRMYFSVATVAVLLVGVAASLTGHWLFERRSSASSATVFAEDYLRRVVEQVDLRSTDRQEIGAFFARELGVSMPPPDVPGFELHRATICLMNGRRGGVVEYRSGDREFSYYVIPLDGAVEGEPGANDVKLVNRRNLPPLSLGQERGLGVATWWDGAHQHALVGNLPVAELERLAPSFAAPPSRL
jgi:anti-sigma factor RsiW